MISNIALQEIHDTFREQARKIAEASRPGDVEVDHVSAKRWHALWMQRGDRLVKLAAELEEMTRQRDMLAQRCAEQAKQIAALVNPFVPQPTQTVADAIATMQSQGIR